MPHAIPQFALDISLKNTIKQELLVPFRSRMCETISVPQATTFSWPLNTSTSNERPRYVIVGFQTNKQNSQVTNPSVFDHCDLQTMYVMLNNVKYPEVEYDLSFPNMQFSRAYEDVSEFSDKFYGMNEMIAQCNISPSDYKDLYPLFVFDVSRQSSDESSSAVVDLTVKARFNTTVPANTNAFAVVISDKTIKLYSDGKNFNVI